MPLSKARDRERKRLVRLESGKFQPKATRYMKGIITSRERATFPQPELDADGNPIPEIT